MKVHWLKIKEIVNETADIKTFKLEVPKDFVWEEGSFTHLALKGYLVGDEVNRDFIRHMSICTLPEENTIGITTRFPKKCSEYKQVLQNMNVGDEVALFKTRSNVPLRRENKNVYFLSAGVGLATFRPLVLDYLKCQNNIPKVYSLNIDSSGQFLYPNIFKNDEEKNICVKFVNQRQKYYEKVKQLANDKDGLFYIVGSDEFLKENIALLREKGIQVKQIMIDKGEKNRDQFLKDDIKENVMI